SSVSVPPQPPSPPRFPYTTLFRSTHALRNGATHLIDLATLTGAATVAIGHAASAATSNDDDFWSVVDQASREAGDRVWRLPMYADRKSTRLNSSHQIISYAVFCLQ